MKTRLLLGFACLVWLVGCGEKPSAPSPKTESKSGNPITAPVDYLGAVGAAQKRAAKMADLLPLQQAIQAFRAGEDRLPKGLQELVTEGYLPRIPTPPQGSRLEYNPASGEVRVVPVTPAAPVSPPVPRR